MSKIIKYEVVNRDTLRLGEDGKISDIIDLTNSTSIDFSTIVQDIENKKNEIYNQRLDSLKSEWEKAKAKEIEEINLLNESNKKNEIEKLNFSVEKLKKEIDVLNNHHKEELTNSTKETTYLLNQQHQINIKQLNDKILIQKEEIEKARLEEKSKYELLIQKLNSTIESLNEQINNLKENNLKDIKQAVSSNNEIKNKEIEVIKNEKDKYLVEAVKLKEKYTSLEKEKEEIIKNNNNLIKLREQAIELEKNKEITELVEKNKANEAEIFNLKREKNNLNIKELGEDLEVWCNQQYKNYAVSGFEDCTFEKINKTIDGEKPDYLFTSYAVTDSGNREPLVRVVCEMKTESLVEGNKKKNSDHIDKLDSDRKKHGESDEAYALLVSELEKNNGNVIEKISNKVNMFMVRPAYFIPFLSIVYNLAKKYKQIVIDTLEFKDKQIILEEFNKMKDDILEHSIKNITTHAREIQSKVSKIKDLCNDIETDHIEKIITHLSTLTNKINSFNINKIIKRVSKLNQD